MLWARPQLEVLRYVAAGNLNKVTGYTLGISPKTVELHRASIMKKMQANSLARLVKLLVIYDGLIDTQQHCFIANDDRTVSQLPTALESIH